MEKPPDKKESMRKVRLETQDAGLRAWRIMPSHKSLEVSLTVSFQQVLTMIWDGVLFLELWGTRDLPAQGLVRKRHFANAVICIGPKAWT